MAKIKMLLVDILLVLAATFIAQVLRSNLNLSDAMLAGLAPYYLGSVASAAVIFAVLGASSSVWRLATITEYLKVVVAVIATVLSAVAITFVYSRMDGVARSLPVLQGLVMLVLLCGARAATRIRHVWRMRQPSGAVMMQPLSRPSATTVLLVGLNPLSEFYIRAAAEFNESQVRIAGLLGRTDRHVGRSAGGYAVLGVPENVENVLIDLEVHGIRVDQIVVTVPREQFDDDARAAIEAAVMATPHLKLVYIEDLMGIGRAPMAIGKSQPGKSEATAEAGAVTAVAARVASQVSTEQRAQIAALAPDSSYWRIKWLIDRLFALVLLVIFAPLILLVGLVVLVDVGAPVWFWQSRPGRFGRPFNVYKFRTMRKAYDSDGTRLSDAERHSVVGSFLRSARLDELPQLWNILIGDMAFIGPRPLLPVDQSEEDAARLLVLPGLTGWAQVSGGRSVAARDKAALDIWYVKNASFWLDAKILVLTIRMVIYGEIIDQDAIHRASSQVAVR